MWQSLIPVVVRFLLSEISKNLPMEQWKSAAKVWVQQTVPGTWFDEIAWSVIDNAWNVILSEVLKANPIGLASGSAMDEVFKNVYSISAPIIDRVSPKS
jgi:hypothetical protein